MGYVGDEKREYQRRWVADRRARWFLEKWCVDCGTIDNLELDHTDRAKKISHRIWSWSADRVSNETAKCVVRCHDCHKTKSDQERRDDPKISFCKRAGHDLSVTGRDPVSYECSECRRVRRRNAYERDMAQLGRAHARGA